MNAKEMDKRHEEFRKEAKKAMPELNHKPGLSMFNDSYDTVAVVPAAALAAADEQAQKTPGPEKAPEADA